MKFDASDLDHNEKLENVTFNVSTSSDGSAGLWNLRILYLVDVLREQQRIKISIPANEKDSNYSLTPFQTILDNCRFANGILSSFLSRAFMENFGNGSNTANTCLHPKGSEYRVTNLKFTDKFFPPMPIEQKFRFETKVYSLIRGRKGWTYMHRLLTFGRYKK